MDIDPVVKVAAVALTAFGGLSLVRQRREQVLNAQIALVREAWPVLASFHLKVRQWADGVLSEEAFWNEVGPAFESTLAAYHRAQLVLDPVTVAQMDKVFTDLVVVANPSANVQCQK